MNPHTVMVSIILGQMITLSYFISDMSASCVQNVWVKLYSELKAISLDQVFTMIDIHSIKSNICLNYFFCT